jgi:hypothetical protein
VAEALGPTVTAAPGSTADALPVNSLLEQVVEDAQEARRTGKARARLGTSCDPRPTKGTNQFCLFLKPGATAPAVDLRALFSLVMRSLAALDMTLEDVMIVPGPVIRDYGVIVNHYRALNILATKGRSAFSEVMLDRFHDLFGADASEAAIQGGFEILQSTPRLTPTSLEALWDSNQQFRLAAAAFCAKVDVGDGAHYVVNGFVPRLMEKYELDDSLVVAFCIRGLIDWKTARNQLLGSPDPQSAARGSLRRELYRLRHSLRIPDIRLGWNGAHLSAGPVEALVELRRFYQIPYAVNAIQAADEDLQFYRKLRRHFDHAQIDHILGRVTQGRDPEARSLIALTEGVNEDTAVGIVVDFARDYPQIAAPRWGNKRPDEGGSSVRVRRCPATSN